jgi:hypothetical protein
LTHLMSSLLSITGDSLGWRLGESMLSGPACLPTALYGGYCPNLGIEFAWEPL